jgi:hypothetical protein
VRNSAQQLYDTSTRPEFYPVARLDRDHTSGPVCSVQQASLVLPICDTISRLRHNLSLRYDLPSKASPTNTAIPCLRFELFAKGRLVTLSKQNLFSVGSLVATKEE